EVLVGGAVAVVRQRHALAGRALARGGATLRRRAADGGIALVRVQRDVLLRELHVAADDLVHVRLRRHREVVANIGEQRALGAREVVAVGGQAGDDGLACAHHGAVVGAGGLTGRGRQDLGSELPIDGAAELVHGYSWPSFSVGANPPAVEDADRIGSFYAPEHAADLKRTEIKT